MVDRLGLLLERMFVGNQLRQNRTAGRSVERTHHTQQNQDSIDGPNGMCAALRDKEQKARAERVSRIARTQHLAALKSIGRVPGKQKQKDARKKLRQPHQSEVKSALGDVVNLPSHRYRLHFHGGHNEEARNLE